MPAYLLLVEVFATSRLCGGAALAAELGDAAEPPVEMDAGVVAADVVSAHEAVLEVEQEQPVVAVSGGRVREHAGATERAHRDSCAAVADGTIAAHEGAV